MPVPYGIEHWVYQGRVTVLGTNGAKPMGQNLHRTNEMRVWALDYANPNFIIEAEPTCQPHLKSPLGSATLNGDTLRARRGGFSIADVPPISRGSREGLFGNASNTP